MAPKLPIYMDNHSTTRVDPRVLEAMLPYFGETFGNAASRSHAFGWAAEAAVEAARERVARLIGASAREIVFTSGATESDNLALKGVAEHYRSRGNHIVTTAIEHKAVIDACRHLEVQGFEVSFLPVGRDGILDPELVSKSITEQTILVSVMLANNEVGTLQPVEAVGRITRERGVLFHCDAVQGVGRVPFDVEALNVDLASLSAHKIYGPKGVGALYVRRSAPKVRLIAQLDGGGHERGMRSGTLNVPAIVGFGQACELLQNEAAEENARIRGLRDRLFERLSSAIEGMSLNGDLERRLPGNLNVSFDGVQSDTLMTAVREIAVSSGSACTSASVEPSYVLRAMGVEEALASGSIRFGLGRFNKQDEVDYAAERFTAELKNLRAEA